MSTTPMTAAQWLENLVFEGVSATGYLDWKTHERDDETGKPFGPVNGVVIHHTAGANSLSLCYNGTSSLPGPLCHTHLSKTAVASMLSKGRANHAGTFAQNAHDAVLNESSAHPYPDSAEPVDGNDHYYGIEIENRGDGADVYPIEQYVAAVKWATAICRHHGWTENSIIGHKEGTRRKIDPKGPVEGLGPFDMDAFRLDVHQALALPAGVWPEQEEDVALSAEDKVWLDAKFAAIPQDVLTRDGIIDNPNPDSADTNPYISLETSARNNEIVARRTEAKVDSLVLGGVDLDALAVKVADEIYRRMAG